MEETHMLARRALMTAAIAAATAALFGQPAAAQNFTKQVTIIVPFAPGGTSDILARLIGPKLSENIGQPVIVENKPGASGNLGADFVAKAAPDGHTLLLTDVGSLATAPTLFRKLSFDVQKDLVPVTMVLFAPYLFAVHPSVPANTVQELVAYAKANPGKLNVGNSGVGAANHLTSIVVGKHLGIDWGHVPYRGGAAAIRAVVTNESNVIFNGATATQPFVVQSQLKGIAVSGDKRMAALPNLPSFKELNLPAVDSGTWQGIHTSKGTPPAMVARLNAEFLKVLAMPDIAAKIGDLGGEVKAGSPDDMTKWMSQAIVDWGKVVQEADIKLD
jgi:tripartite-type tricarboxylate transporter receptor subunit TctC